MKKVDLENKLQILINDVDKLASWDEAQGHKLNNHFKRWIELLNESPKFAETFNIYLITELETDIQRSIDMTSKKERQHGRNAFEKGVRNLKTHITQQISFLNSDKDEENDEGEA